CQDLENALEVARSIGGRERWMELQDFPNDPPPHVRGLLGAGVNARRRRLAGPAIGLFPITRCDQRGTAGGAGVQDPGWLLSGSRRDETAAEGADGNLHATETLERNGVL